MTAGNATFFGAVAFGTLCLVLIYFVGSTYLSTQKILAKEQAKKKATLAANSFPAGKSFDDDNFREITKESGTKTYTNKTTNTVTENINQPVGSLKRKFVWSYNGKKDSVIINLRQEVLNRYNQKPNPIFAVSDEVAVAKMLSTESDDDLLEIIISQLKAIAAKNKLAPNELAELATSFVQSIPYDENSVARITTTGYYKPYQVLANNIGNCLEKSVLLYQLLDKFGYGIGLAMYKPKGKQDAGHAMVVIQPTNFNQSNYWYIETTKKSKIGPAPAGRETPSYIAAKKFGQGYERKVMA